MQWVDGDYFLLLNIRLHGNVPIVGMTEIHDELVVGSKSCSTGITMMKTNVLLGSMGCCMPVYC